MSKKIICLSRYTLESINSISWKSEKTKNKAILFIDHLIEKVTRESNEFEYFSLSYKYLKEILGSHYMNVMRPLLETKIIDTDGSYLSASKSTTGIGRSKHYRINSDLMKGELIVVYINTKKKSQRDRSKMVMRTKSCLRKLRIGLSSSKIQKHIDEIVTVDYVLSKLKVNDEIKDKFITVVYDQDYGWSKEYTMPTSNFLKNLKDDQFLIQYNGKKCIITNKTIEKIILTKVFITKRKWLNNLLRLKHRDVYADRNKTNERLDSNITTLKSNLIKLFRLDDEKLINLDLKNSQFRIFVFFLEALEKEFFRNSNIYTPQSLPLLTPSSLTYNILPYLSLNNKSLDGFDFYETDTINSSIDKRQVITNTIEYFYSEVLYKVFNTVVKEDKVEEKGKRKEIKDGKDLLLYMSIIFKQVFIENIDSNNCLTESYLRFKKLVKDGELYEAIAKRMTDVLNDVYSREADPPILPS